MAFLVLLTLRELVAQLTLGGIFNGLRPILTLPRKSVLINPAKTHPEVKVQAVAARDKHRAVAYANKHGIPQVHESYDGRLLS